MVEQQTTNNRSLFIVLGIVGLVLVILLGGLFVIQSQEDSALEAGQTAVANGNWQTAIDELTAVINTSPAFLAQHTAEATALRGVAYYHQGELENAREAFKTAIRQNNGFMDAYVYHADIHYRTGDLTQARRYAEDALGHTDVLDDRLIAYAQAIQALTDTGEVGTLLTESAHLLPDHLLAPLAYTVAKTENSLPHANLALSMADHLTEEQLAETWLVKTAVLANTPDHTATSASIEQALAYESLLDESQLGQLYLAQAQTQLADGNWQEAGETAHMALAQDETLALAKAIIAYQHYRQEAFEEAMTFAEDALALEENPLAFYVAGSISAWSGQFAQAQEQLNQALSLDPQHIPSLAMRAYVHYELDEAEALQTDAEEAMSMNPNHPDALWAQAMADLYNYDDEMAYMRLSQAIALDDTRAEFYIFRTKAIPYAYLLPLRIDDLEEAVALAPEQPFVVHENFIYQYLINGAEGEPEEAHTLIESFPDHYAGPMMLAEYFIWQTDDLETALEYAQTAVNKQTNQTTLLIYGRILYTQGELEQAKTTFEEMLTFRPNSLSARRELVRYYNQQDNQEEVDRLIAEIFDIYPNSTSGRVFQSVYQLDEDPKQAWQIIHEVLTDDPQNPEARADIALTYFLNGQSDTAIEFLDGLIDDYPHTAAYRKLRAILHADLEAYDEAIEDAEQALALEPADKFPYVLLANIAVNQNDFEDALDYAEAFADWPFIDENAQFTLVNVYTQAGESEQALDILAEIEANSDDPNVLAYVYFLRGAVYGDIEGDAELAREQLNIILDTQSNVTFVSIAEEIIGNFTSTETTELDDGRTTFTDNTNGFELTIPEGWEFVQPNEGIIISAFYDTPFDYAGFDLNLTEIANGAFTIADVFATLNPDEFIAIEQLTVDNGTAGLLIFDLEDSSTRIYQYILIQENWLLIFNFGAEADSIDTFTDEFEAIFESFNRFEE